MFCGRRKKEKVDKKNIERTRKIGKIVKQIISCNGYKTKDELIKLWGSTGVGDNVNLMPLYDLVKGEIVKKGLKKWREKEDPAIVRAEFQRYISGYKIFEGKYLNKEDCKEQEKMEVGMKVSWMKDDKRKYGVIKNIKGDNYIIQDKRKRIHQLKISDLFIEESD